MGKRVLVLGITNLNNMGDNMISESTEYLVKKIYPDVEVIRRELFLKPKKEKGFRKIFLLICSGFRMIFERASLYPLVDLFFRLPHKHYYEKLFEGVDYVIVTSGMLKYSTQCHSYMYSLLSEISNKKHRPLLLSAKSIEIADYSDYRCRQLKKALSALNVSITTRDGDKGLDLLRSQYGIKGLTDEDSVGDPALWMPEIVKADGMKKVQVGINLIRPNIFKDYGQDVSTELVIRFYKEVIKALEGLRISWKLFSNGMEEDNMLASVIVGESDRNNVLFTPPHTTKDLIDIISSCEVVLGLRLHSLITAYAYDVPVVGVIWDSKLRYFADQVGLRECFIEPDDLDSGRVTDLILRHLNYNIKTIDVKKQVLKLKTLQSFKVFLST